MEEFDDLVPTPDKDGYLELSYRGWDIVDEVIWTMGRELISLNLSFNSLKVNELVSSPELMCLKDIAPELGDLQVLRELNISCNKIETIPKQVPCILFRRVSSCYSWKDWETEDAPGPEAEWKPDPYLAG